MNLFHKIIQGIFHILLLFVCFLLCLMVVLVFSNVVLRYIFNSGIHWSEEISLVIVIWFTFIAMALGVKEGLHISINLLPKKTPKKLLKIIDAFKYILEIGVAGILFWNGIKLTKSAMRSILPASGLPNSVNYLVVPLAAIFICIFAILKLVDVMQDTETPSDLPTEGEN